MPAFVFYALGPELVRFSLDPATGALTQLQTLPLPGPGQYAVLHPAGNCLYAATGKAVQATHIAAFSIDPVSGALRTYGDAVPIPARAIHIETDPAGSCLFTTLLEPGTVIVHRLAEDGTIGSAVEQSVRPEGGVFVHQARVTPDGRTLIVCSRGNDEIAGKPEDAGALSCFAIADGVLTRVLHREMPPDVGPRHLDFDRQGRRAYILMERGNTLRVFPLEAGVPASEPTCVGTTLAHPGEAVAGQRAGAIHLHPTGRFLYVTNRARLDPAPDGAQQYGGGENSVAVFAIEDPDGAAVLLQHLPVGGLEPRSFAIDPSGRWLIVANQYTSATAPDTLDVFLIGEDGRLTHKDAIRLTATGVTWVGFAPQRFAGN